MEEAKKVLGPLAQAAVTEEEFQRSLNGSGTSGVSVSSDEDAVRADTLSEQEAFQFLRLAFAQPSDTELCVVIREAGGDIRKAVDKLLGNEYLSRGAKEQTRIERDEDSDDEGSIWAQRRPGGVVRPKIASTKRETPFPLLPSSPQRSPIPSRSPSTIKSRWDVLDSQIAFLSQSLSVSPARVRSAFHLNSSSLPRTLRDLLKDIPDGRADQDIVANLQTSFRHVDKETLRKIVIGTKHDIDSAMELTRILDHDRAITSTGSISVRLPARPPPSTTLVLDDPPTPSIIDVEGTYEDMKELKLHYLARRNEAIVAASNAYKRSRSESLRSGVAAYYASVGREYDVKYRHYAQLAANRLVAQNSSKNILDLHGVSVRDAMRIVEEEITKWWARVEVVRERGEVKAVENFVVVVGRGNRSKTGSKLGPSVSAWLRRNGWGFNEARGELVVWGLRRDFKKSLAD